MSNNSNNWCPEIYRNLFVDRFNQDSIRIAPCCQAESSVESINTFDFNNNKYLNKLREQNKNNERPTECSACWEAEDIGQSSRRLWALKRFDNLSYDVVLEGIDHSATWACNLACVMCGPINSSLWANELKLSKDDLGKLGRQYQKLNKFTDSFDISSVVKLHFNGGEPLLTNEHLDLLEHFDKQDLLKNVYISYNTNGTVYPSQSVLDMWAKARRVKLYFSIDGVDTAFNYIRWPGDWNKVSDNILKIKSMCSNVDIGFNATVGNYNILELDKVWQWFRKNINDSGKDFNIHMSNDTAHNLQNLLPEIKLIAVNRLSHIPVFTGFINYIKDSIDTPASNVWINKFDVIDARRGTNWRTALEIGKYY